MGRGGAYQLAPPLVVMSTPPSLLSIIRWGFFGSIQTSWWSPWCAPLTRWRVAPPSVVFSRGTWGKKTTSGLVGWTVRVLKYHARCCSARDLLTCCQVAPASSLLNRPPF